VVVTGTLRVSQVLCAGSVGSCGLRRTSSGPVAGSGRRVVGDSVVGDGSLALTFQRLQSLLLSLGDIETFLQQLTELAAGLSEPPASCGITVRRDGQPVTVTSSDVRASALDESQYETDQGPCLHSMRTGQTVVISDVATEVRWPVYMARARKQGLMSSLSLPLAPQGTSVGAMNIYRFDQAQAFDSELRQGYEIFAAQAAGALHLATLQTRQTELRNQLEQALTSRSVIDQAIGILMAEQRCQAEEAFHLLRLRSQSSQQKLRDVAAVLVTQVGGDPLAVGKPFDRSGDGDGSRPAGQPARGRSPNPL
jgi:GAF domain-containing protein